MIIVKDVQKSVSILSNKFYRDFTNEEISNFRKPTIGEGAKFLKMQLSKMVQVLEKMLQFKMHVLKTEQ